MAAKTVTDEQMDAAGLEFNPPLTNVSKPPRAPSVKRPDGADDLTWAIMRTARNEDVPARINAILAGEHDPDPNEAAILLEIVVGAERKAVQEVIKLRTQMAPKMQAASALVGALGHIRERLFRDATRL